MRFKIGQEVVCIDSEIWEISGKSGPRKNEIYTINWIGHDGCAEYLGFIECNQKTGYEERFFAPTVPQSEINALFEPEPECV